MQKIGLVGLYSINNMGDCLICETTRFILEDSVSDAGIIEIDAAPREFSSYPGFRKLNLLISAFLIRAILPLFSRSAPRSKARYYFERLAWHVKTNWHFKQVIPDCDALIFSGGGFLKFKNQGLNYLVEQIIEICEQHEIPVMFSGVGIEGFDPKDHRCKKLKSSLASPTIHTITTRDYLEILRDKYEITAPTHTQLVGDPAFWAPDCYGIRKDSDSQKIGINLIREDIFQHYGNRLSPQELKSFYIALIERLDEHGADWILFSNGMSIDHDFGQALLIELGKPPEKMLPPPRSAQELISVVSSFKAILGARMHASISAYALDIPVVGLIWNEKLTRFAELTQQRQMFFNEGELNAEVMCTRLLDTASSEIDDDIRQDLKRRTQDSIDTFIKSLRAKA